jgi:hypothetical protein
MPVNREQGQHHGRRGLAAKPGPRQVRGDLPRERDRLNGLPNLTAEDLKETRCVGTRRAPRRHCCAAS